MTSFHIHPCLVPPSINLLPSPLEHKLLPHTHTHTHTPSQPIKAVAQHSSIVQAQIMIDSWLSVVVDIVYTTHDTDMHDLKERPLKAVVRVKSSYSSWTEPGLHGF